MSTMTETRPRRPLQPHGTTARAYGRPDSGVPPCDCVPCVTELRRYSTRQKKLAALGRPGRVPAARSARHVRALADAGMTWLEIMAAAQISQGTLANLLREDAYDAVVNRGTQARILAVSVPPRSRPGERRVDGTGTRRRRQALARIGWSSDALSEHSVLNAERLRRVQGAERVTVATRDEVAALYRKLEFTAGPSRLAALGAERKGWALPAAWTEETIDDPAAKPSLGERAPRPLAVLEDVEFVRRTTGVVDRDLIAQRLRITRDALEKNLERAREMTSGGAS